MNKKILLSLGISMFALCSTNGFAQTDDHSAMRNDSHNAAYYHKPLQYGADRLQRREDPAIHKFRENRFGGMIHWGLYAIPGGEWKGKWCGSAPTFIHGMIPKKEYDKFLHQWNPVNYDAKKWAKMYKEMGVKYITITTKHHEGFCLWPSKYSDYTVAQTPYKKDLIGPLVKELNKVGIDIYFYYSVLDWHHPDWRYKVKTKEDEIAFKRFLEFSENQLVELCEKYPTVKGFWFDGTWDTSIAKQNPGWTAHIEKRLKSIIPGLIISSRLRADDNGKRHFDSNGYLMGDYCSGYERNLPKAEDQKCDFASNPNKDTKIYTMDWETCVTVPNTVWGYYKDWSKISPRNRHIKTPFELIDWIAQAASMGGNFLLNFGPQPDGDFRPEEKHIAKTIGQWMKKNGEAIYGCSHADLKKQDWGHYTQKGDNIYMIVINRPYSGFLPVVMPNSKARITECAMLDGSKEGKKLTVEQGDCKTREWSQFNVMLPEKDPGEPFVVKIKIK